MEVANTPSMHEKFVEEIFVGPYTATPHTCRRTSPENENCEICFEPLDPIA